MGVCTTGSRIGIGYADGVGGGYLGVEFVVENLADCFVDCGSLVFC